MQPDFLQLLNIFLPNETLGFSGIALQPTKNARTIIDIIVLVIIAPLFNLL
jgi:hypothetical protein